MCESVLSAGGQSPDSSETLLCQSQALSGCLSVPVGPLFSLRKRWTCWRVTSKRNWCKGRRLRTCMSPWPTFPQTCSWNAPSTRAVTRNCTSPWLPSLPMPLKTSVSSTARFCFPVSTDRKLFSLWWKGEVPADCHLPPERWGSCLMQSESCHHVLRQAKSFSKRPLLWLLRDGKFQQSPSSQSWWRRCLVIRDAKSAAFNLVSPQGPYLQ